MPVIDPQATVGQLVAERPARAQVFERHGIDFCCGGKIPLAQACAQRGLDPAALIAELAEADAEPTDDRDWTVASLAELAAHIERTYHDPLREQLPRLMAMAKKVAAVHGDRHEGLHELSRLVDELAYDMLSHMQKEEHVLFPMIRAIERGERPSVGPGRLEMPVSAMVHEHDDTGRVLARMRELTADFTPPEGACNTYRALFDGLARLDRDMHVHVHKENNILFPRALAVEAKAGVS